MDPTATLKRFMEACEDDDRDTAHEALSDLREWIGKGGFLPSITHHILPDDGRSLYEIGGRR